MSNRTHNELSLLAKSNREVKTRQAKATQPGAISSYAAHVVLQQRFMLLRNDFLLIISSRFHWLWVGVLLAVLVGVGDCGGWKSGLEKVIFYWECFA